ncbi:prepilin peptidase [Fonticella tunisiensis]|uniref:Leader peptidase (Prepilin peptidase)/N-methyltransferase n=1 Tax=Fonticella tunisiensis TaxID=1096341 RepID=A0A4R7KRP4_9CLOT|nr:A24 family peptidase [Fonticella tunisiensis]TDT61967.1 leader peptidase (prepilin peptidase)/N-methyltransferase [Fonticella tunisiensis]
MLLLVFIFGLIIGSFLNVCIYRIPRGESISCPPSHCTSCGRRIRWYDMFPVLSYLLLRGKCRFCGDRISIKYPLIELTTGALFAALYINYGLSFEFIKFALFISLLIVIGIIDLNTMDVYLKTTIFGVISGIVFMIIGYYLYGNVMEYISGGLLGGGTIALIIILTKGMGWGDAEICLVSGLFLGLRLAVVMLFLSFVIGGFTGIALILLKKKSRRDYIPFGPFIALSSIVTTFFGERILTWYLSLL